MQHPLIKTTALTFVILGLSAPHPAGAAVFRIIQIDSPEPATEALFGTSVAGLDDIDGDGLGDFAVGAPGTDRVYVMSGADQSVIHTLQDPDAFDGNWFGYSVRGVGDMNADGIEEIAVGAPGNIWGIPSACDVPPPLECLAQFGRVFVFSGSTGDSLLWFGDTSSVTVYANYMGTTLAPLGDVDWDGTPDLAAGAPGLLRSWLGRVFGLSGNGSKLWERLEPPTPPESTQEFASLGLYMTEVSDLTGDGLTDLLVAAPWYDYVPGDIFHGQSGRAYVLSGADGSIFRSHDDPSIGEDDLFGVEPGAIGDQNWDGLEDYAFGEAAIGVVHTFSGDGGVSLGQIPSPVDESLNYFGFGYQIARVDDRDGDGRNDFWVASPDARSVYLMNIAGDLLAQVDDPNAYPPLIPGGFGWSLAALSDLNGDGAPDLLVGKTIETVAGFDQAGAVFLVLENSPPVAEAGPAQTVECAANTTAGTVVSLDGIASSDLNGDPLTYSWTGPFTESPASGATPVITLVDGSPGVYEVTLTVNDGLEDSPPDSVLITVEDTTPPQLAPPPNTTVECDGGGNVTELSDWLAAVSATDTCGSVTLTDDFVGLSDGCGATGSANVTWTAVDESANTSSAPATFAIEDTLAPELALTVDPTVLWPPNHRMVALTSTATATDLCDSAAAASLTSITMDEGDETDTYHPDYDTTQGDGHTTNDIQVEPDGSIHLRAERSGGGDGRVYAIAFEAEDACTNSATDSATVTVPHSAP